MGLFDRIRRRTNKKAIFCGLDKSGKTTIISFLDKGRFIEHTPTMGKEKKSMEVQGTKITLFDMGGQTRFRKMWQGELAKDTKCVVFVIDRADPNRFPEAKKELDNLIPILNKNDIKLLIFANKSDLNSAVPLDMIYDTFNFQNIDSFEIIEISAKTGFGMADAFIKFYSALTGKELSKTVVASAISIYSKGGIPLVTANKNNLGINDEVLQGGFLSAVTNFATCKMGDTCVKFESKQAGTFIIKPSSHFIGALLWKENLKIPIEDSETALGDLLQHIESVATSQEPEEVAFIVTQYCTNMF